MSAYRANAWANSWIVKTATNARMPNASRSQAARTNPFQNHVKMEAHVPWGTPVSKVSVQVEARKPATTTISVRWILVTPTTEAVPISPMKAPARMATSVPWTIHASTPHVLEARTKPVEMIMHVQITFAPQIMGNASTPQTTPLVKMETHVPSTTGAMRGFVREAGKNLVMMEIPAPRNTVTY